MLVVGACFIIWCLGWCMKDTGTIAQLRRHGLATNGTVVHQWTELVEDKKGPYKMLTENFWADVEYERKSPTRQLRWLSVQKWYDAKQAARKSAGQESGWDGENTPEDGDEFAPPSIAEGDPEQQEAQLLAGAPELDHLEMRVYESKNKLKDTQEKLVAAGRREEKREFENYDGAGHHRARKHRKEMERELYAAEELLLDAEWAVRAAKVAPGCKLVTEKIKCSAKIWNKAQERQSMRIVYDPMVPSIVLPASLVAGSTMSRGLLFITGAFISVVRP
eukprot:COSAG05_NODE_1443_length_4877_cov_3.148598_4_plen_277_part_00